MTKMEGRERHQLTVSFKKCSTGLSQLDGTVLWRVFQDSVSLWPWFPPWSWRIEIQYHQLHLSLVPEIIVLQKVKLKSFISKLCRNFTQKGKPNFHSCYFVRNGTDSGLWPQRCVTEWKEISLFLESRVFMGSSSPGRERINLSLLLFK